VVAEDRILNPEGLRFSRRVRAPQDAGRDRATWRSPVRLFSVSTGRCGAAHKLNHAVSGGAFFADPTAWTVVTDEKRPGAAYLWARGSPGAGRRGLRRADVFLSPLSHLW